jgi:hypothetical protein
MLRDASQHARIEKLERDEGAAPLLSMRAAAASVSEMGEPGENSDELGLALDARLGEDRGKLRARRRELHPDARRYLFERFAACQVLCQADLGRGEIERPSEQKFDFFQIYQVGAGTVRGLPPRRSCPDLVQGSHGRRSGANEFSLELIHVPFPRKIPRARRLIALWR